MTAAVIRIDGSRELVGAVPCSAFGPAGTLERVLVALPEAAGGGVAELTSAAGRAFRLYRVARYDDGGEQMPVALYRRY